MCVAVRLTERVSASMVFACIWGTDGVAILFVSKLWNGEVSIRKRLLLILQK